MSISTTRGDHGTTAIIHGERIPKDHPRIECLGALDELNAFLGDAKCAAVKKQTREIIGIVQGDLFSLMAILAVGSGAEDSNADANGGNTVCGDSDTAAELGGAAADIPVPDATRLAAWVRELEAERPIRGFIVPGTCTASAKLDIARTVCRRAERRIITLDRSEPLKTGAAVFSYMNRLSDLLFMLARFEER
jgi:cob(I)alamin adenosyltransferase